MQAGNFTHINCHKFTLVDIGDLVTGKLALHCMKIPTTIKGPKTISGFLIQASSLIQHKASNTTNLYTAIESLP